MRERVCKVLFCLTLLIFGALRPFYASAQETVNISQNSNVLILSSYSYEWESIPKQLDGITDTLNGYAKTDYVFMHTKRLKYEEVKEHVYSYLLNRIEKEPYDYVIAGDDAALQFVMEYRDELFSGIPIIFE